MKDSKKNKKNLLIPEDIEKLKNKFQEKYCPTCRHYDLEKKDLPFSSNNFIENGRLNSDGSRDYNDCKSHATGRDGVCINYKTKEDFAKDFIKFKKELQERYCPNCILYKEHLKNSEECDNYLTDDFVEIIAWCKNYHEGGTIH